MHLKRAESLLVVALVGLVVATRPPLVIGAALLVGGGLLLLLVHALRRPDDVTWSGGAVLGLAAGAVAASASLEVSAAAWSVVAVAAGVLALVPRSPLADVGGLAAAPLLAGGACAAAELAGLSQQAVAVSAGLAALAVTVAAALVPLRRRSVAAGEAGGALSTLVALVAVGGGPSGAASWTVVGAAACAVAAVAAHRRWYVWPGVAALVVAYVLLVVDSGSTIVEAYTLPLGVAGLAAGLWWMRRNPTVGSWAALGGGLAAALLPSTPQALADPTGLRALLLGAGAVGVLAVGARRDWQAPFLAGSAVAALVLLFNVGPYANAAPRVAVIAAVSAALVAVGVTWEDRVRDGRRIVAFVKAMR